MKRVLLVDYDENHLRQLRRLLEGFEAKVEEVKNGVEGLNKISEEEYDVIIASTIIPGLNGFELTRKIRIELGKTKLPVILVSSVYKGAKYKYEALHVYGADYFFEFPLNEKEFFTTLKKYLPEKAPTTTMKMETLHGKPLQEGPMEAGELITTDELFGDILQEVEKEMSQQEEGEEKIEEPVEEVEEIEEEEEIKPEAEEAAAKVEPEEILKEILEPSRPKKKKEPKKKEDLIEKILEETLSGLGERKKTKPASKKTEEPEKEAVEPRAEKVKVEEIKVEEKPSETKEEKAAEEATGLEELVEEAEEIVEEEPFGPLEEPSMLGEYILLEKISTGGMAEIYKAKKKGVKGFEKIVALKKILPHLAEDEEFIEMFIDEAKVASKLNHPNIAQIYDLGKINGSYFIAMEYVLGKDLKTILRKIKKEKRPLPPIEISSYIVMKIAEALDYAHRKVDENGRPLNIVHRDVSPQNILISYEGEVKLVDFGVAKASIKAHQTIAGSLKGKLLYMSPEQAKGDKNIDGRSDIFSLGTVFYELVTGEKAFLAQSEAEVLDKVRKGSFKPPRAIRPEIPAEVERIIMKAMEPNPAKRYQRASDMRNDIEKFLLSYKGYIPSARDVAEFMYELFEDEIKKAGIDVQILKAPRRKVREEKKVEVEIEEKREKEKEKKPIKAPSFGVEAEAEKEEERKTKAFPIILVLILALALAAGVFFFLRGKGKTAPPKPPSKEEIAQELPPPPTVTEEKPAEETPAPQEQAAEQVQTEQPPQPSTQPAQPAVSKPSPPPRAKKPPVSKPKPRPTPVKKTSVKAQPKPQPKPAPKPAPQVQPPKNQPSTQPSTPSQKVQPKPKPKPAPVQQKPKPKPQPAPAQSKPATAKPQIREGDVIPYSLLDSKPRPTKMVSPRKPSFPKRSGIVFLSVLVGPDGRVEKVKLIRGIHPRYDDAAIKAVQRWKFTSPMKEGKRVRTWTTITIKY